ncbi:MAG TPA: DUF4142 domain-containing protein [Stellaceae bacterium]|nr:DUF4142 domain-containing protein [Stellaceae bacterium]
MPPAKVFGFAIVGALLWVCAPAVATAQQPPATAPAYGEQAAALTDPQIANIAYTAGVIDIENARLALKKSHNPAIRAFARDMIRDHTAVNRKALALVKKLHVTPQDNPTSQSLVRQSDNVRAELAKMSGKAFDKAYIDNEVAYHKAVNGALQNKLIPDAKNPQLKSLLETGLKIFEGHEKHAEQIASRMG